MFSQAISSPNAPKAIGPYSSAIKLGDFVYLSGMLPIDPVTGSLVEGDIQEQTQQVLRNIEALLLELNLEMRHVVKTTVYMTDLNDFDEMNAIYGAYFAQPYPARTTVEVKALPKDAMIEIECVVIDTLIYEKQMEHKCCGHHDHHEHEHCCGDDCECGGNECECDHDHGQGCGDDGCCCH